MPRFSVFLVAQDIYGKLGSRTGLTNVFLQPQPNQTSVNPSSKSPDADSITLTEALPDSPGVYYAEITNPAPRYDLYVESNKETNLSGSAGFNIGASKSIFFKKNLTISSGAYVTPDTFTTGSGQLTIPDGGQTWPKFSSSNPPIVIVLPPSEVSGGQYIHRIVKLVRNSIAVDGSGNLSFDLSLDPNGPVLATYYCDVMILMP